MRVAYFDAFSGVSGDMTVGALIDAGADAKQLIHGLEHLNLGAAYQTEKVNRFGITATKFHVLEGQGQPHHHAHGEGHDHSHEGELHPHNHRGLSQILELIEDAGIPGAVKANARRIFQRLGEVEASIHGLPLEQVHFHEVGALDSIADIVGAAVGLDLLGVDSFTSSPVAAGSGTVKCAHGIMPVPTPGTAELLKGVPLASCPVKGELATPTGAAILTAVVSGFTASPAITIERIGHGAGTKDPIEQPNILRLLVGTVAGSAGESDSVVVLETNVDDASPEVIGFCQERLFAAGSLDVFVAHGLMKKGRPGFLITVIATPGTESELEAILFREAGTFGIRRHTATRTKLQRESVSVDTPWGPVKAKRGWRYDGFQLTTPEYDDCARVAREHGVPLRAVYDAVRSK